VGEVLHGSLLQLLLEHCDILNIDISQGSVAIRLRCGWIFKYELVANLPVSLPVKEFWKTVNISGSYGQEFGVLFFSETQCRLILPFCYRLTWVVLGKSAVKCVCCMYPFSWRDIHTSQLWKMGYFYTNIILNIPAYHFGSHCPVFYILNVSR